MSTNKTPHVDTGARRVVRTTKAYRTIRHELVPAGTLVEGEEAARLLKLGLAEYDMEVPKTEPDSTGEEAAEADPTEKEES